MPYGSLTSNAEHCNSLPYFAADSKHESDNAADRIAHWCTAMPIPHDNIGGRVIHVNDCYIWSEIYYLDSPTDYRECLPASCICPCIIPRSASSFPKSSENNLSHLFLTILAFLASYLIIRALLWENLR